MLERVGWPVRIACAAAAGLMFHPDILTDILGWAILIAVTAPHVLTVTRQRKAAANGPGKKMEAAA
jgi:UPF0716 family protein affecting phage T7 exclusion